MSQDLRDLHVILLNLANPVKWPHHCNSNSYSDAPPLASLIRTTAVKSFSREGCCSMKISPRPRFAVSLTVTRRLGSELKKFGWLSEYSVPPIVSTSAEPPRILIRTSSSTRPRHVMRPLRPPPESGNWPPLE